MFLLDLLFSICLSLPLILMLTSSAHFFGQRYTSLQNYSQLELQQRHLQALFQHLASAQESQRFFAPRLHHGGRISLASGSRIRLSGIMAPLANSHAVSAIELDIGKTILTQRAGTGRLKGCGRYQATSNLSSFRSFLGISSNGLHEFSAQISGSAACKSFRLLGMEGLFTTKPSPGEESFVRALIPIKRSYTIYVNKHRELRYLGMRGDTVIENQPIMNGISNFTLNFLPTPDPRLKVLNVEALYTGKQVTLNVPMLLSLAGFHTFSMNRP